MDNNVSTIKERVLYLVKYHGEKREKFFRKIDMTYGSFKGGAKKTCLNSDAVAKILSLFPDVEPMWLLTGEGSTFKTNVTTEDLIEKPIVIYKTKQDSIKSEKYIELLLAENAQLTKELEEKQRLLDEIANIKAGDSY